MIDAAARIAALVGLVVPGKGSNTPGPTGPQGARGRPGGQGPVGPVGPTGPAYPLYTGRFFNELVTQYIYVSTTGSDTTGDGIAPATAYASPGRALRDLPPGWTANVVIQVAAGTYAGAQSWTIPVLPGPRTAPTTSFSTGRVFICGDVSTPVQALTGGVAGALLAGKVAQITYAVGAYAAAVTDGSHFVVKSNSGADASTANIVVTTTGSATPNMIFNNNNPSAMTNPTLNTWTTIFSGTIIVNTPAASGVPLGAWFSIIAIRFNVTGNFHGAAMRGCRWDVAPTLHDCSLVNCVSMTGTVLASAGDKMAASAFSSFFVVTGGIALTGRFANVIVCLFRGAPLLTAKCQLGGQFASPGSGGAPAWVNLFSSNDFEGTGSAIKMNGGSINASGSTGMTFAVTGSPYILDGMANAFTPTGFPLIGTGGLPSTISGGSALDSHGGYVVTNSVTPGQDVTVGALPVQAVAVRPTVDPTQLCRYS